MGNPDFAVPALRGLCKSDHTVAGVVTGSDKPSGRGRRIRFSPVKEAALTLGLPVLQPDSLKDDKFIRELKDLKPDLAVVVAFSILPPELINIPKSGTINLHASLLPKYRGAAPINRAIMNGETETGVSVFFIEETVDTGTLILLKRTEIGAEETAGELYKRLSTLGAEALIEAVDSIEKGDVQPREQNHEQATKAPKIKKEEGAVDWRLPAVQIFNRIRGLYPVPGCYTYYKGKRIGLCKSRPLEFPESGVLPGQWVQAPEKKILVKTGEGVLDVFVLKPENKKEMSGDEFIRGYVKSPPYEFSNAQEGDRSIRS
jgi:methionyl-tRNA formyltransferase